MSLPRRVLPGQTLLIGRRCSERRHFLRPSALTRLLFFYLVGVAANRFGVQVHALLVMSNHYHMVITDVHGRYPAFLAFLHKLVAKCLNRHWGRKENLWSSEQTSVVLLTDEASVLDKVAYTLANPACAGLVTSVQDWPGASSWLGLDGRVVDTTRPKVFFRARGSMPSRSAFRFTVPPAFEALSQDEWRTLVQAEVRRRERAAARKRKRASKRIPGLLRLLTISPFSSPRTEAPRGRLNPQVAGRNQRGRTEALQSRRTWLDAYRSALSRLRAGFTDVLFPAGTYELARLGLVSTHPA